MLKKQFRYLVFSFSVFYSTNLAQIGGIIDGDRVTNWKDSGLNFEIPQHSSENALYITEYTSAQTDSGFYETAIESAINDLSQSNKYVVYFPEGEYIFRKPITITTDKGKKNFFILLPL